jgi:hypothetical protein
MLHQTNSMKLQAFDPEQFNQQIKQQLQLIIRTAESAICQGLHNSQANGYSIVIPKSIRKYYLAK